MVIIPDFESLCTIYAKQWRCRDTELIFEVRKQGNDLIYRIRLTWSKIVDKPFKDNPGLTAG